MSVLSLLVYVHAFDFYAQTAATSTAQRQQSSRSCHEHRYAVIQQNHARTHLDTTEASARCVVLCKPISLHSLAHKYRVQPESAYKNSRGVETFAVRGGTALSSSKSTREREWEREWEREGMCCNDRGHSIDSRLAGEGFRWGRTRGKAQREG